MASLSKNIELFPGSKDWTQKYFHLVEEGEISFDSSRVKSCSLTDFHLFFMEKGILFGVYSSPIFFKDANANQWTKNEQLRFLLFESLLSIYLCHKKTFDKDEFIQELISYYAKIGNESSSFFSFLEDKTPTAKLERILESRCEIKSSFLSTNRWINHIENSYIFLDVILFDYYLNDTTRVNKKDIDNLKFDVLISVIKTLHIVSDSESEMNTIFNSYLSSSGLSSAKKQVLKNKFDTVVHLSDFHKKYFEIDLFRYFLLDIAILITFFSEEISEKEEQFLENVAEFLQIEEEELLKAKIKVQQFALRNKDFIPSLTDSTYEKMLANLSNRWVKIISRNKNKFVSELSESKELIALVTKATTSELSEAEKKKAVEQFKDVFLKSMPLLAIFMLPGGAILLPLILKIIPALLPSSFRDNEVQAKDK